MENKNQQQSKKNRSKANRYLYIAAAAVMCLGAILTGVLLSVRNRETPVNPDNVPAVTTPDDDPKEPDIDVTKILPEFVAPAVGLVTQSHDLDVLVFSKTENLWRVHRGIDISCKAGAAVMAAADGKVSEILDDPFFGKTVKITHNGEGVTIYLTSRRNSPKDWRSAKKSSADRSSAVSVRRRPARSRKSRICTSR